MDKIQEIIYLPSVRCNLNCKHCGENQDVTEEMEMNGRDVLLKIAESCLIDNTIMIEVSGGEPFLNLSLEQFLLEGIRNTTYSFGITSNGYFYDRIERLVSQIEGEERKRLSFNISIDGLEKTHNKIRRNPYSFKNAIKTVRYLVNDEIAVNVNMVVQTENINELEELRKYFKNISPSIRIYFIPFAVDIGEKKCNIYTPEYQQKLWKYDTSLLDRKKILSKGKFVVKKCHAGNKNIVIGPDGNVYVCLTGAYYKGKDERSQFCIGNLKESTLDEILLDEKKREGVYKGAVACCTGCSNPCELNREVNIYGQSLELLPNEINLAYQLDIERKIGCALIDYSGWNVIERYEDGSCLCWSCDFVSKVFIVNSNVNKKLKIIYRKLVSGACVKIAINGKEIYTDYDLELRKTIVLEMPAEIEMKLLTLSFITDTVKTPFEVYESEDHRYLGVGIEEFVWTDDFLIEGAL